MRRPIWSFVFAVMIAVEAHAGIIVTLDDPAQTGSAGQTLNFFGTITNNSSDTDPADAIYLNSDSFSFELSGASYTLIDNFANTPVDLVGGQSSGDIDLFDITLTDPQSDPLGTYNGTYGLIGGADGGADTAQDNLGQSDFSVTTVAPEPGTGAMIGGAMLAGLLWAAARASARA